MIVFCSAKIELNLNSRWLVFFVLRLVKPVSENSQRFRSAKVKVTHCLKIISIAALPPNYFSTLKNFRASTQ